MAEIPINRRSLESELNIGQELTPERFSAIRRSIELGKILRDEHPEIKDLYKKLSLTKIVEELHIKPICR